MAHPHSISRNLPLLLRASPRCRYRSSSIIHLNRTVSSSNVQQQPNDDVESRFPLYTPEPPSPSISLDHLSHLPLKKKLAALSAENERLEEVVKRSTKVDETEQLTKDLPEYTEQDLEGFYSLLLSTSSSSTNSMKNVGLISAPNEVTKRIRSPRMRRMNNDEREEIVGDLMKRLNSGIVSTPHVGESTSDGIQSSIANPTQSLDSLQTSGFTKPRHDTLKALLNIIKTLGEQGSDSLESNIPMVGVSRMEWTALIEDFVANGEGKMAVGVLDVMQNLGIKPSEDLVEHLLFSLSQIQDIPSLKSYISRFPTGSPQTLTPSTYLISTLLKLEQPHQSLPILHSLESYHLYPPQQIYTSIIRSLLTSHTPLLQSSKALAWDLFVHSRLIAYPTPTEEMYALIIRSCADPRDPQPERALDLWVEMKSEGLQPTSKTYEAIILACAKVKKYYHEAFRLFREMVGMHQALVSSGTSSTRTGYEPTIRILNALLEGTKRNGDLTRARWILAEAIKLSRLGLVRIDESMVVGVLQSYAAFKPVLGRSDVKVKKKEEDEEEELKAGVSGMHVKEDTVEQVMKEVEEQTQHLEQESDLETLDYTTNKEEDHTETLLSVTSPSFSPTLGPQTSSEVIQEVNRLFHVILQETSQSDEEGSLIFSHLTIGPKLINAFLSVHLAHSPLKKALETWNGMWSETGVELNSWSHLLLIQRLAYPKNVRERQVVREKLPEVWKDYERWVLKRDVEEGGMFDIGQDPREIEKIWSLAIRAYALLDNTTESLRLLDLFTNRFPFSAITTTSPLPTRSTILSTSPLSTLEDNVPPHILFPDIEMLHHRLVRDGDIKGLAFVKWVCKGYEAALGKRRKRRMKEMGNVGKPRLIRRRVVEGVVTAAA